MSDVTNNYANREAAYDAEIAPLMTQIIATCKAHKIPMLADFDLSSDDDPGLKCTTVIFGDDWPLSDVMKQALSHLRPRPARAPLMVTVAKADGSKVINAIL
jgi:hypothetical protein